jgi:serine/threonine-protein kinase
VAVAEAVSWTLDVCEAVAEAHAVGIAHGDLRPDNVWLSEVGAQRTVKVAWTSAAKAERAAKQDIGQDMAALGVLLRVLVTGRFERDEDEAPTLPGPVLHVIARALGEDPAGRFSNVVELARTLEEIAPRSRVSRWTFARTDDWLLPASHEASHEGTALSRVPPPPPGPEWRSNWPVTFLALALVGFLVGGSWMLWQGGPIAHRGAAAGDAIGATHLTSAVGSQPAPFFVAPADLPSMPVSALPGAAPEVATVPTVVRHATEPAEPTPPASWMSAAPALTSSPEQPEQPPAWTPAPTEPSGVGPAPPP